jgi:hypothetical protein
MNIKLEKQIIDRCVARTDEFNEIVWTLRNLDTISDDDLITAQSKLGVTLSKLFAWSPSLIATVFVYAMEDSNAHSFNEDLIKLIEKHSYLQD